ncbi:ATP-binding cassette domain-containing protein [Kribbella sandramycini]|uniref:UvrABC system protein A n=1 Tax=Kribbella sandramycini TaxID=60450 RepID=A0A7Y4NWE6_9ACTN|nr:ATP-binding cassette domain-containing protein [Kribbella sandramycini]MBB6568698.1 excinuclease UvrABC ATPase subunit [Kribbella sandramycini]NOL38717.1 ATP-binding cassette domain-containing protein [Kribbella sandramycini]
MSDRVITLRQARTNNLAAIDLDVPRNQLVVFVGRSGSGKSSLVFDTIAAEAGYQLNETYPPFARNRLPKWKRPEVEHIDGLTPVIVVDQRRIGGNARSTVGTTTDSWTYLRLLFSRLSEPYVGESNRFSFNDPSGMCPVCSGLGEVVVSAVERFLDLDKSLADGAIRLPGFGPGKYWHAQYADIGSFDADTPLRDWTPGEREALLYGGHAAARLGRKLPKDYEGVVERFERVYLHTADNLSERKQETIRRFTRSAVCAECAGERLAADARTATVRGRTIGALAQLEITELLEYVRAIDEPAVAPVVSALVGRLEAMVTIGLGYLALARATTTLSGGESQRIKTVKHLGSSLTELTYVVDEPTVGLHPTDVDSMIALLEQLRDSGNSVLVVEHDPAVMRRADQIVEVGPGAGDGGGRVVFQGTYDELLQADTPTGRALRREVAGEPQNGKRGTKPLEAGGDETAGSERAAGERLGRAARGVVVAGAELGGRGGGELVVRGASRNNLRGVTVGVPSSGMTVLTGVAGSGKSSLAAEFVAQHGAVVVDQAGVGGGRRSTPVTYTGIAAAIRKLFAQRNNVSPALFSANSAGACPECRGLGVVYTDLAFLEGQEVVCPECAGRRFTSAVLEYTVGGYSIADVDRLTIEQAIAELPDAAIARGLQQLAAVGLGYLRLGQSLNTLSGGECQRVKIAKELRVAEPGTAYVLDEPTTGLHLDDIATLLGVLDRLVERGHAVLVVEHNLEVIRRADWLIDLGPGPGRHGGTVLYEGRPEAYRGWGTPTSRALDGVRDHAR